MRAGELRLASSCRANAEEVLYNMLSSCSAPLGACSDSCSHCMPLASSGAFEAKRGLSTRDVFYSRIQTREFSPQLDTFYQRLLEYSSAWQKPSPWHLGKPCVAPKVRASVDQRRSEKSRRSAIIFLARGTQYSSIHSMVVRGRVGAIVEVFRRAMDECAIGEKPVDGTTYEADDADG